MPPKGESGQQETVAQQRKSSGKRSDDSGSKKIQRKPAKYGHSERQVVDYVRTATAKNVWYYRYDRSSVQWH